MQQSANQQRSYYQQLPANQTNDYIESQHNESGQTQPHHCFEGCECSNQYLSHYPSYQEAQPKRLSSPLSSQLDFQGVGQISGVSSYGCTPNHWHIYGYHQDGHHEHQEDHYGAHYVVESKILDSDDSHRFRTDLNNNDCDDNNYMVQQNTTNQMVGQPLINQLEEHQQAGPNHVTIQAASSSSFNQFGFGTNQLSDQHEDQSNNTTSSCIYDNGETQTFQVPVSYHQENQPKYDYYPISDSQEVEGATVNQSEVGLLNSQTNSKSRRGRPRKKGLRAKGKVNGKLWEFIRDLLLSERTNPSFIRWERREDGVFKFVQSDKVAKMWGERKQNPKMTYEKLSRAMRYYYKSRVLLPVFGRRLVYKFGPNATGWLGDGEPSKPTALTPNDWLASPDGRQDKDGN